MGNSSPSALRRPPVLGTKLICGSSSHSDSRSQLHDQSAAYLVAGPPAGDPQPVPDVYVDACGDSALCCSTSREAPISFISREEALMKARYYKDRNPELAKQAYLFALSFRSSRPTARGAAAAEGGGPLSASSCGCSFVRCGFPQPMTSCWASKKPPVHTCPPRSSVEPLQTMPSAEAMSTAFTSGSGSRMHTDDLDELVVPNPVAHRLPTGDLASSGPAKDGYLHGADNDFKAEIHAELAQLHLMNGEPLEALECYQSASALAPDQLAYAYRRGVVLQQMGDREKAVLCFREVLKSDASYKPAIFNLGVCLAEEAATRPEALRLFESLLSLDPNNDNALELIADIHEQEGRVEEAYAAKQKVVTLDPSNFRAGRDLARLESTLSTRGSLPGYITLN
ncbi:hypothetical protein Efla_006784 [Eimeria flavescens]